MDESGIRLKRFLQEEGITQKQVGSALGISCQYINAVVKGRKGIGKAKAVELQKMFGVSAGWLLTGDGEMYAQEKEQQVNVPVQSKTAGKPYYNVDFRLGFDVLLNDQTQNPDYLIDFPPYNDCDCWCNAYGNSMYPTIASGDIVALKRITDISYLINGEIYAIVTSNGLRTIKRIRDNGTTFTLIADNKEVGDQNIPKEMVTHVFLVRGTIKMF